MPLLQYFGWVGSLLLAALFATNWYCARPIAAGPLPDVPLDQKVHIRIHTDHKWPERVVLEPASSAPANDAKAPETEVANGEQAISAEHPLYGAFAEMAPARPCFRPPCFSQGSARARLPIETSAPFQSRARLTLMARKPFTAPNPFHRPPGRS